MVSKPLSYHYQPSPDSLYHLTLGQQIALSAKTYGDREGFVACLENVRYSYVEILQKVNKFFIMIFSFKNLLIFNLKKMLYMHIAHKNRLMSWQQHY